MTEDPDKKRLLGCGGFGLDIIRYVYGELDANRNSTLETHIKQCSPCREFILFAQKFNQVTKRHFADIDSPGEPCPDALLIVRLESEDLDPVTAQHVRAHILHCRSCAEEYLSLRRSSDSRVEERAFEAFDPESIAVPAIFEKLASWIVDLGRNYGPGTFIGSVRVLVDQPALVRGTPREKAFSKVLEVKVQENKYSLHVSSRAAGETSWDIASIATPNKAALHVTLLSESGSILATSTPDEFGNSHFAVNSALDNWLVLVLALKRDEQQILFRIHQADSA